MSDTLTTKEVKRLGELGQAIQGCLSCDINDNKIPCRTDRLEAVKLMKEYLKIHSSWKGDYIDGMIVDGTDNDPTIISLDNARIVSEFDKDGEPIFNNSILVKELLN